MIQSITLQLKIPLLVFTIFSVHSCDQSSNTKAPEQTSPSLFTIISTTEDLKFSIQTDIQLLLENKEVEGKHFQDAEVTIKNNEEHIFAGNLKLRPRGITRRSICSFPPIMIKPGKKEIKKQSLGPSYNMKLVTHCEDSIQYNQWVLKEYLAYKMFNVLVKESFNVQYVEVTYLDLKKRFPPDARKGFIIEPLEELSIRCDCPILQDQAAIKSIDKEQYKLLTFFQFMIGNTDWNLSRRHNIRLLNCHPEYGPTPVPYDFDFSGFVHTSYAKPHPLLPIQNVKDRLLQWRGDINEDFTKTIEVFNTKKASLMSLVKNENGLSESEKESSLLYLQEFYTIIASPDRIKKEIEKARSK